jgi:septum formation topological specificity factor MinE
MSYSLRIDSGDLVVGNNRALESVTGKEKLFQDLKLWILERIGTDPATPLYGSTLDGGQINGQQIPSLIGQIANAETLNAVKSEILDLLQKYQQSQLAKMKRELIEYNGRHTLSGDEVLYRINSVSLTQIQTMILARVSITTLNKNTVTLTIPVQI